MQDWALACPLDPTWPWIPIRIHRSRYRPVSSCFVKSTAKILSGENNEEVFRPFSLSYSCLADNNDDVKNDDNRNDDYDDDDDDDHLEVKNFGLTYYFAISSVELERVWIIRAL